MNIYSCIYMDCVISPQLFVLVMEMILRSADFKTNQITGPSMKTFKDDVTVIAESRSHMEQLVTHLQELFKWAAMKIKPSKYRSLLLLKRNCKEIKLVLMHLCYRKKSRTFPRVSGKNRNMPKRVAHQIYDKIIQSICLLSYNQV